MEKEEAARDESTMDISIGSTTGNEQESSATMSWEEIVQRDGESSRRAFLWSGCLTGCLVLNAILYGWQVHRHSSQASVSNIPVHIPKFQSEMCDFPESSAWWVQSLDASNVIVTQFIHAALLMGCALLVRVRGDLVWLYFLQTTTLFWGVVALVEVTTQIRSVTFGIQESASIVFIVVSSVFGTCSWMAYLYYHRLSRQLFVLSRDDVLATRVIRASARLAQLATIAFVITTGVQWMDNEQSCQEHNERDGTWMETIRPTHQLGHFIMGYSETTHNAFLLALFQLAAIYPGDVASVSASVATSAWRLLVAVTSLLQIVQNWDGSSSRSVYSLAFTALEFLTMVPILVCSVRFLHWPSDMVSKHAYETIVDGSESSKECGVWRQDENEMGEMTKDDDSEVFVATFRCMTLSSIASSDCYSSRQRWGAWIVFVSSAFLFVAMTAECIVYLSQQTIGSEATHELYKWGLHVVAMFVFCFVMGVERSYLYKLTRPLLILCCPLGSGVAVWQLSLLSQNRVMHRIWLVVTIVLLVTRILSGLGQTIGLLLMKDTEKTRESSSSQHKTPMSKLQAKLDKARHALYKFYIPATVLYVGVSTLLGNCSEPMISKMLPVDNNMKEQECIVVHIGLVLEQNWPGLGLMFHFGLVPVIFAYDGLRSTVNYKPSLLIASFFFGHVGLLALSSLIWDMFQTELWSLIPLLSSECIRRLLLVIFTVAALNLSLRLGELWNARTV